VGDIRFRVIHQMAPQVPNANGADWLVAINAQDQTLFASKQ